MVSDASMGATSPDAIAYLVSGSPINPISESAQQATTIQTAFSLRPMYNYVWANAAAKTAQTGMRVGDKGFQSDAGQPFEYLGTTFGWCPALITHPASNGGRMLQGQELISPTGSGSAYTGTVTITFPLGFFNATPQVTTGVYSASPLNVQASYTACTAAGFKLCLGRTDGAYATTVSWSASQGAF